MISCNRVSGASSTQPTHQPHLLPLDLALELWKPLIHKALPLRERRHVLALRGFFLNVVVSAHSVPQGSNLILHLLVPLRLDLMILRRRMQGGG